MCFGNEDKMLKNQEKQAAEKARQLSALRMWHTFAAKKKAEQALLAVTGLPTALIDVVKKYLSEPKPKRPKL